jgi:hypothetical protein
MSYQSMNSRPKTLREKLVSLYSHIFWLFITDIDTPSLYYNLVGLQVKASVISLYNASYTVEYPSSPYLVALPEYCFCTIDNTSSWRQVYGSRYTPS